MGRAYAFAMGRADTFTMNRADAFAMGRGDASPCVGLMPHLGPGRCLTIGRADASP